MTITAIRTQVAALVHASVLSNPTERLRHERFIMARLAVGTIACALTPAYLAWRGTVGAFETVTIAAAFLPLLAVFVLSRTGRLDLAHCMSATALALFICALAGMTGGAASPLLFWLAIVPAEARAFGSRGDLLRSGLVTAVALVAMVLFQQLGLFAQPAPWLSAMMPVFAALAVMHVLFIAGAFLRDRDGELRERRASDARGQILLDNVGDLVTWHDATGSVLFANAAARALTGAEPEALRGRGLLERVHIADRPLFLKALNDAAHGRGDATACFRTLFVTATEMGGHAPTVVWLEMHAYRVEGGQPGAPAVICVMRDITARHALDEERARGHAEALQASDIKRQFLATVSHELRTPLNAIIGFSEVLGADRDGALGHEKRLEYAQIVHASGHHLLEVVNTLLDVTKIESGSMTIEQEPVDLAEMTQNCCAMMDLPAQKAGVTLDRVVGPALPAVLGDRRALKQVVINLLSNAVKFTPKGGRVALAVVRDGDMIDLSVADTGIGISASDLPRLGDPFFQAKGSYDRTYEGTGLGLSVVRGLVGLHGGRLTVESAPGLGTRVSVRLPIGGVAAACQPVKIATFARAPRRGLDTKEPLRLTA